MIVLNFICADGADDCSESGNGDGFLIFQEGEVCDRDECLDSSLNDCDDEVGICSNIIGGEQSFECS